MIVFRCSRLGSGIVSSVLCCDHSHDGIILLSGVGGVSLIDGCHHPESFVFVWLAPSVRPTTP